MIKTNYSNPAYNIFKTLTLFVFFLISAMYISICIRYYQIQDKFLFFPSVIGKARLEEVRTYHKNVEEINIETKDGPKIHSWLLKQSGNKKASTIIYFGGINEDVSYVLDYGSEFGNWNLCLVDYRGYGLSEGKPSQDSMFDDALEIYDYLVSRNDIDKDRIVVMGRSLGTGVATYLSGSRHVSGTILVTPYDSIVNIAQEKIPYLPMNMILKHKFNSIKMAPKIKTPLLSLIAQNDTIIPINHSENLDYKWGGQVRSIVIKDTDHGTIWYSNEMWREIVEFLNKF